MKTIRNYRVLVLLLWVFMTFLQSCKKEIPLKNTKAITAIDFGLVQGETLKIDEAKGIIYVNIPWVGSWNLQAFITHTGTKIEPQDSQFRDYANPVEYKITAEDGSTKVYTIIVSSATAIIYFNYPTVYKLRDQDFYKYLVATTTNATHIGAGKDFLVAGIGTEPVADRKDYFGFDIFVPSSGLVNGQPYFLGTHNVSKYIGLPRAITTISKMTGVSILSSNKDYIIQCESGTIKIDNYDSKFKLVSGTCRDLVMRELDSGAYFRGNCDFLNVPLK